MRNIRITTFVLLMLGTAIIGSGHLALARNDNTRDLTNSGNYLVNDQNCTAGNSCNLTSSNTVTSGSSGLTSPPPSTSPTPTTLTLVVAPASSGNNLMGTLKTNTGSGIAGATITFTQQNDGGQSRPLTTTPSPVETDTNGNYHAFPTVPLESGDTITAHYAGAPPVAASSGSSTVPTG